MSPTDTSVHPQDMTEIFQRVLEVDDLTDESNFFEAGGDSLLATRVLDFHMLQREVENQK